MSSIEQDEQVVQELVDKVLAASLEDQENTSFEQDLVENGAPAANVKVTITKNIEENTGEEEQEEDKTDAPVVYYDEGMNLDGSRDGGIDGTNDGGEETVNNTMAGSTPYKIADEHEEPNLMDLESPQKLLDVESPENHVDSAMRAALPITPFSAIPDAVAEVKFDEDAVKANGDIVTSTFEPNTPPAIEHTVQREEHQLAQHEQQQTLFNPSEATAANDDQKLDSGEESELPNTCTTTDEHNKNNNNDDDGNNADDSVADMGKSNGKSPVSTATSPGKAEQKAKTKLCNIL